MYYTYIYLDPRKEGQYSFDDICFLYEPFYVGKGKGNRYLYHMNNSRSDNIVLKNKINKLIRLDIPPYVERYKYVDSEEISYTNEINLITQIGSDFISEIEDGPLLNICLKNQPPNLSGKTYKDIYGDRFEEEIEKRRKGIKENHRLHKRTHTDQTKEKISQSLLGENNHRWGVNMSNDTKNKISQRAKERLSISNPSWRKWLVTSPSGEEFLVENGLRQFCSDRNISYSTLRKCLFTKIPVSSGRTSGWNLIEYKT